MRILFDQGTPAPLRHELPLHSVERRIAIVVLNTTSWPRIRMASAAIADAVTQSATKRFIEISIA